VSDVTFELCPETGIGCLIIKSGDESVKIDLMPDEAADLQTHVQSDDLEGARTLLTGIDRHAEAVFNQSELQALAGKLA
jgi:hypothetical protein